VPDYRIDDLASAAGMTTRNIRAYQSQGLLPAPRREGRVAWYSEVHLARLRLIGSLLERGYSAAHIEELIGAWEGGRDLSDVLGIERVLVTPFTDEVPTYLPLREVRETLGGRARLARAEELGIVRREGKDRVRVERPRLLGAIGELSSMGMGVDRSLELYGTVRPLLDQIADRLVGVAVDVLTDEQRADFDPTDEELAALVPTLERMRVLAMTTVTGGLAQAFEESIERALGTWFAVLRDRAAEDHRR
jgi:DNA-binding transcriptional MerR regulator